VSQLSFMQKLEAHGNVRNVRERLASGKYHSEQVDIVKEWLRRKEEERSAETADRAEAREEENLSISRKALRNSQRANIIAIIAMVLSAATAIIVAVIQFMGEKSP
jgi:type IV secretory pathway component VirB8